ncbi:unnamed protein product [Orchesella dallaii]|uniref:Uncharacterized protein n=1 Tax=Orchesella dallaii TaxID=48710 RepID=A0ABP1R911_9HEXA
MKYLLAILLILKHLSLGLGQITINVNQLKYDNTTVLNNQNFNPSGTGPDQATSNNSQGPNPVLLPNNSSSIQKEIVFIRFSPYFGVEYGPNVESRADDKYSIDEIKKMLKVILTKSNSILTYSMGIWYSKHTGSLGETSYSLTATAAAQLNKEYNKQLLSISQGASILLDGENSAQPDIENAFLSAQQANGIYFNTVSSITFRVGAGYVEDQQSGQRAITEIRKQKLRAHGMGLKVGIRVNICGDIQGGPNQQMLTELATTADYFVCSVYPPFAIAEPSDFVNYVTSTLTTYKSAFAKVAPNLEIVFRTGLASEGDSYKNPAYMNTPQKSKDLWDRLQSWVEQNKVRVFMHEAFDTPASLAWNDGHSGYWKAVGNGNYVEKGTGQVVNV